MKQSREFTEGNFQEEILNSKCPVLVEFWASWCPPCKMLEPLMEKLAKQYQGKIKVGKLNVDQNPKIAIRYQIKGVPTFILLSKEKIVERKVGAQSEEQLGKMLNRAIGEEGEKRWG